MKEKRKDRRMIEERRKIRRSGRYDEEEVGGERRQRKVEGWFRPWKNCAAAMQDVEDFD